MLKEKCKHFFNKCRNALKKASDKAMLMAAVPFSAITAETTSTVNDTEVDSMLESIKGLFSAFSVSNLVKIIGAALALGVILFLFWFAYRFIKRAVVKALKKGNI